VSEHLRFTRGAIVGMNEIEEGFPGGRGQIRIKTEDPVGFAGPFDDAGPKILFEAAGMGDSLSERQMVRAAPELLRLARGPRRQMVIRGRGQYELNADLLGCPPCHAAIADGCVVKHKIK
jgi:hypothetical protein